MLIKNFDIPFVLNYTKSEMSCKCFDIFKAISVCYFLIKKIEYINDVIRDRNDVIIHEGNEIIGDLIDRWDDFVKCSEMYRPYEHSIWFNWSTRCRCKLHFNFFFFFKDIDSSTNFFYPSFFQTFLIYGGRDTRSFLQLFCRQLCRVIFDPFDKDETLTQVANKFLFSKLISPFF